jgi:hypothetical protein
MVACQLRAPTMGTRCKVAVSVSTGSCPGIYGVRGEKLRTYEYGPFTGLVNALPRARHLVDDADIELQTCVS